MNRRNGNVDRTLYVPGPRLLAVPSFVFGALLTICLLAATLLPPSETATAADGKLPLPTSSLASDSVLFLNSYHKGFPWSDNIVRGVEETFAEAEEKIDLWVEYMDAKRFSGEVHRSQLYALYRHKFEHRKFGAIITSDNAAFQFMLRYRQQLFGETPVIFCGVNGLYPDMLTGHRNITGIAEHAGFRDTILLASKILPETRNVIVIIPDTISANEDRKTIEGLIPSLGGKPEITFWQGLGLEETLARAAWLEAGTVILSSGVIQTESGRILSNREKVEKIATAAHVPVFVVREEDLGTGALGGRLISGYAQGRQAARTALQVLRGQPAEILPLLTNDANPHMFDYSVMQRFGIAERDLPEGSIIVDRPESAYERYRTLMTVAGLIIVILAFFIGLLSFNIHKRKQAEIALRESEERLKAIIENSPSSITLKNLDRRYVLANREFTRWTRFPTETADGKTINDLMPPEVATNVKRMDSEVLATHAVCEREIELHDADGSRHTLIITKFPVFDAKGELKWIGSIGTDISDRKKASEQMRVLQAELAHVSRLSTMGEMAAGFAHELNQPLAAINNFAMGCAHRLQSPNPDIATISAVLSRIAEQAQRASDIIRNVRGFVGKKDEERLDGALPQIDINGAIRAAIDLLHSDILESDVNLDLDLSPNLPSIQADAIQIQQVVVNLARNSMEAMKEAKSDPRVLVVRTGIHRDDTVEIRVSDTGPGIAEDILPKLFEPFFTTKSAGMGMGLSICRSIVVHHGGNLSAANRGEGGADFRVVLPISSADTGPLE